jgi:hypothetical protein
MVDEGFSPMALPLVGLLFSAAAVSRSSKASPSGQSAANPPKGRTGWGTWRLSELSVWHLQPNCAHL